MTRNEGGEPMEQDIRQGDIYYYDFGQARGSVQAGNRPVLVIQAATAGSPTVIVAAVTSVLKKPDLASHVLLPGNTGLERPSMVLLEQLRTVDREELSGYAGSLNDRDTWQRIDRALIKTFGIRGRGSSREGCVQCLCPECAGELMKKPGLVVKRLDPFARRSEKCGRCRAPGFEYFIWRTTE